MIRAATPADIPAMRAIEAHALTAAHWTEQDYQGLFTGDPPRIALVVEAGPVQGFLIARQIGPEWELENIAVAGGARRRGMASALVQSLLKLIEQQGGGSVFLEVRRSNAAARALYRKHGFAEAGRRPGYYQNPEEDAVLYRK